MIKWCVWLYAPILMLLLLGSVDARPLRIELTTHLGDRQHFRQGDEIKLLVSMNRDAYILLLYRDAKGRVLQLFPNRYDKKALHKAGSYFPLPPEPVRFRFLVGPPFGQESFWLFAASEPLPRLEGQDLNKGIRKINLAITAIKKKLFAFAKQRQILIDQQSLIITTSSSTSP